MFESFSGAYKPAHHDEGHASVFQELRRVKRCSNLKRSKNLLTKRFGESPSNKSTPETIITRFRAITTF